TVDNIKRRREKR
ncbi:hypothetical protein PF007_g31781, partial [Phytophthora fragariae]